MAIELQRVDSTRLLRSIKYNDPWVIGTGALILGYVIGSGRWSWLTRGVTQVASGLGMVAVNHLVESFQEHNPHLFSQEKFVEHP